MPPTHIGRYEIQRRLGKGGIGSLYLARDPGLDRLVAIKLFKEDYLEDQEFRERFSREARALARLRHPNIVTVFDVGEHEGLPFMAMEYIDGETLRERLVRTPPLTLASGLAIVEDLCAGLAIAHDAGIVHRDIKPDHIMINRQGVLKLLDFGIGRITHADSTHQMSQPGMIMGTYNYMSPEQLLGEMVDKRSDIFAVGAVLYQVIAREQAFPGAFGAVYHSVLTVGPVPLEERVPGVDPTLVRIVKRALERSPQDRYQDANDVRKDLSHARQRLADRVGSTQDPSATIVLPRTSSARRQKDTEAKRGLVSEQLRLGEEAFARSEFDASLQYGERAAFIDPDSAAAMQLIDRSRAAIETQSIVPVLEEAKQLLSRGQIQEALTRAEDAWASVPDLVEAGTLREQVRAVLDQIRRASEREERIKAVLEHARSHLERADYDNALRSVYEVLALDPEHAQARELEQHAKVVLHSQREQARARHDADVTVVPPRTPSPVQEAKRLFDENVQFTVFRPRALAPAVWHTMLVFAHLSEPRADASPDEPHPVKEMERQAEAVLGTLDAHGRQTVDSLESVPRDGELRLVPHAEGITFNPPSRQFTWKESVHREEFRLMADAASRKETIRGRLSVYLGSLVIAEVGLIFKIGTDSTAGETVRDVARRYRNIFASYSHMDEAVVEEFSEYARAMGDRYLRDVIDLRAGERWQTALEDLIRHADVFQLFWSWNALASPHVRHEWQYALSLQRASFVRPVYWDDPLPARGDLPPASLSALHFERIQPRRLPSRGPSAAASVSEPPPPPIPPVPSPREHTATIAIPIADPRPVTPPRPGRPAAPVSMSPPSARDPDTGTVRIPVARPPASTAPASAGRPRPPWRIIGSIAAGIVLFVVGTGFWLGAPSSPVETPPTSVGSPGNTTPTPPAPPPPTPVQPPSPVPGETGKAPQPPRQAVPLARVTIRVLGRDAPNAPEAEAKLVEAESGRTVTEGVANDRGTIVLDYVSRGRYRLIVSVPGHPDLIRDVRVDGDQTIEIDLDGR